MDIRRLMMSEAKLINTMLKRNGIKARVDPRATVNVAVGYISYGLQFAMDERFAKAEGIQRELSNLLTNHRRRNGIAGNVQVIPVSTPRLALEVPHPRPEPLLWSPRKVTSLASHTMLVGRSFVNGPRDERIAFDDAPHVLICGITGAGKTMLLQTMLLSLCAGTSPDEVRLVLVDLKNEDLAPFETLPHVETFAGTPEQARRAIQAVVDEKDKRVRQRGYKPYRLVLVVDEMAQLTSVDGVKDNLGDLASIGRSKLINLVGATQHPTEKGGLGTLLKANFPIRLVGMVAPGQSHIATGRPKTHAELLPGKGAFLRCQSADVYRFQSFFIEPNDVELMVNYIATDIWRGHKTNFAPVQEETADPLVYAPLAPPLAPVQNEACTASEPFLAPLAERRPLTDDEAVQVQGLYQTGLSKTALCERVYGSKSSRYFEWLNEALDRPINGNSKIIRLRRAS